MKKIFKAINNYFFPGESEEMHWSDYAWFYGSLGFVGIILIFLLTLGLVEIISAFLLIIN